MAILTRYPTAPTSGNRPPLAWKSGLSPNRRWVPARLPANGSTLNGWTSQYGDLNLAVRDATKPLSVGQEGSIRYVSAPGTGGYGFNIDIADPSTVRTAVVIARPNTGDTISGTGRILRFGDDGAIVQADADTVVAASTAGGSGVSSLAAVRGKWHVYSISLPAVGSTGQNGVFAVDNNSTTFSYNDAGWPASALRIAASSSTTARQLRIVEILTSPGTFTAAELIALYAKAKAWYPGLAW